MEVTVVEANMSTFRFKPPAILKHPLS